VELGAEPAVGDARDPEYVAAAMAGVDAAYVLSPYDPTHPDYHAQQAELGDALVAGLRAAAVPKIVALSAVGADVASGTGVIASMHAHEQRLTTLDADVLVLRPGAFFETFFASLEFISAAGFMGDVYSPDVRLPMVASRDVATFAVKSLRERSFEGKRVQELLGPRKISYGEAAAVIGQAIGRPDLEYVQLPPEQMSAILADAGLSADFADQLVAFAEAVNDGTIAAHGSPDPSLTPTTLDEFAPQFREAFQQA
jgi:uncharacterized protein YbjT (DUF2867 family)